MDIINYKFTDYLKKSYDDSVVDITKDKHIILYGMAGTGKYHKALHMIKSQSPSELKYEKKVFVLANKQEICIKLSDIHYEVDFETFNCNSRQTWNIVYDHIMNMVENNVLTRYDNSLCIYIICKNFHLIHNELLEIFASYLTQTKKIKLIMLTDYVSFIPNHILCKCLIYPLSMKPNTIIEKIDDNERVIKDDVIENVVVKRKHRVSKKQVSSLTFKNVPNLYTKYIYHQVNLKHKMSEAPELYTKVCMSLIYDMELYIKSETKISGKSLLIFRDKIYNIFTYHLDFGFCIWIINYYFIEKGWIINENHDNVILHILDCYRYMNNNYREIFHAERWLWYMIKLMKENVNA